MGLVHLHFSIHVSVDHLQLGGCASRDVLLAGSVRVRVNLTAGSLDLINSFSCLLSDVVGVVRVERPLGILEDSVLCFDAKALVFFLIEFDEKLTGVQL